MPRGPFIALLLALALAAPTAAAWRLEIDPERSRVGFTLGATLHDVRGSARLDPGSICVDPEGGTASGRIVVQAASLETGNEKRDRIMHRAVLESETFPEISLEAMGFEGRLEPGGGEAVLTGAFELHGGRHPVELEGTLAVDGDRFEATVEFVVPYVAWGLSNPSKLLLRVAREVTVELAVTGAAAPLDSGPCGF